MGGAGSGGNRGGGRKKKGGGWKGRLDAARKQKSIARKKARKDRGYPSTGKGGKAVQCRRGPPPVKATRNLAVRSLLSQAAMEANADAVREYAAWEAAREEREEERGLKATESRILRGLRKGKEKLQRKGKGKLQKQSKAQLKALGKREREIARARAKILAIIEKERKKIMKG